MVTGAKSPQEALDALRANAELQQKFNLAVLAADTELEKAYLSDRADARNRDIEVRKVSGGSNTRADVMVVGAVLGRIACLAVLCAFRKEIPGEAVGIVSHHRRHLRRLPARCLPVRVRLLAQHRDDKDSTIANLSKVSKAPGDMYDRASDLWWRSAGCAAGAEAPLGPRRQSFSDSARECRVCDESIPLPRRKAIPGVNTCIDCQADLEHALNLKGSDMNKIKTLFAPSCSPPPVSPMRPP